MIYIQDILNEFSPCVGVCPGCEEMCTSGDGRTPDVDMMADAIIDLRAERDALRTELDAILTKRSQIISVGAILEEVATLRAERDALWKVAAFFRSVILSGEKWSEQCQEMYGAALAVQP
jgi:hypothetical protein